MATPLVTCAAQVCQTRIVVAAVLVYAFVLQDSTFFQRRDIIRLARCHVGI